MSNVRPDVGLKVERRVFISAAEPSGDAHGASLIRAVREMRPDVRFVGAAGPRMVAEGCESIFDMTAHAAMLLGAVRQVRRACDMLTVSHRCLCESHFDAAVVIDSPVLHLPLAALAKGAGVPVMYYIAPQVWAWRESRVKKLRERVDRLAVILPFEEAYFRERGVEATYVGHPLADALAREPVDEKEIQAFRGRGKPLVALLPGSRKHVVRQVLPGQLEVAERIAEAFPGAAFAVSVAGKETAPIVSELVRQCRVTVEECTGRPTSLIRAADLVLVASGTMTLEVAMHHKPMIVMYNASRFFYQVVGRWLVRTPYLSLPNILAGRELVPEFMPYYTSTEPIARRAIALLSSEAQRAEMVKGLSALAEPLSRPGASQRAGRMLLELMDGGGWPRDLT